ncbi:MAG: histidinol-phosphatase [Actinocatenispora sp.]
MTRAHNDFGDDLSLAHVLADAADAISMSRFRAMDLRVESKPDMTPVTDADKAVEESIRASLSRARPRDAVLGEEFGGSDPYTWRGNRQWIIDPIDGTANFVRGVPIWATLIALFAGGQPVVGLVSAPALGRRWWAALGHGAYAGRNVTHASRLHVSGVNRFSDASFCYSDLGGWQQKGKLDGMLSLIGRSWRSRAYGDFYGYMLLAEGALEVMVEPELSLWDVAALITIVNEAGGRFTDLCGQPSPGNGSAVATNGPLHDDVLDALGDPASTGLR